MKVFLQKFLPHLVGNEVKSCGIQIGEQRGETRSKMETIVAMWEEEFPMPKIAKFTRSTIEEVQAFMRKIAGDDNINTS